MARPNMKPGTAAARQALPMHRAKCPACKWRSRPHPRKAKAEEEYAEHWARVHGNDGEADVDS